MSYLPLARKYRPLTFSDLVGQEDTAQAIANGIKMGREAQAIIFSGVRGIGKTTTARLYAKALNCEQGPTAEPCNQCDSCLAINQGSHEDVLEIDGASNTGVEDVRILKETVTYAPQRSKYKVYIIDEVHMLSQSAFNALLKTLEEPPSQVVFLFATTELHKVPQTIISRCQTFYLSKFKSSDIISRLKYILEQENLEYEERALTIVAKEAHGSMRDALTLLDQAVAFGDGKVSIETLNRFVSAVSTSFIIEFIDNLLCKDSQSLLASIQLLEKQGVKYSSFVDDLATWLRHLFIVRELGVEAIEVEMLGLDAQEVDSLLRLSQDASVLEINRLFRVWVKCRADLSGGEIDRFIVENVGLEWCLDPGLPNIQDLLSGKFENIPVKAKQSQQVNAPSTAKPRNLNAALKSTDVASKKKSEPVALDDKPEKVEKEPQLADDLNVSSWKEVVQLWSKVKPLQAKIFEDTYEVAFSEDEIVVAVDAQSLAGSRLMQLAVQTKVEKSFAELFKFKGKFRAIAKEQMQSFESKGSDEPVSLGVTSDQETLREERMREKDEANQKLREDLRQNPITKFYMESTDSDIESIELS